MKPIIILLSILLNFSVNSQVVIDNGKLLTSYEESLLTQKMLKMKEKSSVQILIYTTMDLGGKTIFEYSTDLSNEFGVGIKGVNNGIIILISKNDGKLRISSGLGLEWILTDEKSQVLVDGIVSEFKNRLYYIGLNNSLDSINKKVSSVDWNVNEMKLSEITENDIGKIIKIKYLHNNSEKIIFKYGIDTDEQFLDSFNIKLISEDGEFTLFYSKYMNDLVLEILTRKSPTIYFRLIDWNKKKLELMGVI